MKKSSKRRLKRKAKRFLADLNGAPSNCQSKYRTVKYAIYYFVRKGEPEHLKNNFVRWIILSRNANYIYILVKHAYSFFVRHLNLMVGIKIKTAMYFINRWIQSYDYIDCLNMFLNYGRANIASYLIEMEILPTAPKVFFNKNKNIYVFTLLSTLITKGIHTHIEPNQLSGDCNLFYMVCIMKYELEGRDIKEYRKKLSSEKLEEYANLLKMVGEYYKDIEKMHPCISTSTRRMLMFHNNQNDTELLTDAIKSNPENIIFAKSGLRLKFLEDIYLKYIPEPITEID